MIDNPLPADWRVLQKSVCNIMNEIGLHSEVERVIKTPRGKVEIDVLAINNNSLEQITYAIECKNWNNKISQTTVHAFTTVMTESGFNLGYIISKYGLQAGALSYIKNTNIKSFTYLEFQEFYLKIWLQKYFILHLLSTSDSLIQYTEPVNNFRDRHLNSLPEKHKAEFYKLKQEYKDLGYFILSLESDSIQNISQFIDSVELVTNGGVIFNSIYYRDLLKELDITIIKITNKFNLIFGKNIFT